MMIAILLSIIIVLIIGNLFSKYFLIKILLEIHEILLSLLFKNNSSLNKERKNDERL